MKHLELYVALPLALLGICIMHLWPEGFIHWLGIAALLYGFFESAEALLT